MNAQRVGKSSPRGMFGLDGFRICAYLVLQSQLNIFFFLYSAIRYNMMTHLKAHQGIYREYSKMYKCPFCVQTFQRKLKLQEHLTRDHNTVVDSTLLKPVDRPKKHANQIVEFVTDRSS